MQIEEKETSRLCVKRKSNGSNECPRVLSQRKEKKERRKEERRRLFVKELSFEARHL